MKFNRSVLMLFVIALLFAIVYGFTQGSQIGQRDEVESPMPSPTTASNNPTITVPSPPPGDTEQMQRVQIYVVALEDSGVSGEEIGCGDSLVPVTRDIPQTQAVLQAALTELFSLDDQYYGESGFYNALYNSDLQVDSAEVQDGTATINLSGQLSLGGVCDNPRVEGQIRATAQQFETVENVEVFLNGEPLQKVLSGQ